MEADSNINGLLRHLGTIIGAYLVHKGWIDGGSTEAVIGAIVALGSVGWSIYNKKQTSKAIDKALELPTGATRTELKQSLAADPDATPKQ